MTGFGSAKKSWEELGSKGVAPSLASDGEDH